MLELFLWCGGIISVLIFAAYRSRVHEERAKRAERYHKKYS